MIHVFLVIIIVVIIGFISQTEKHFALMTSQISGPFFDSDIELDFVCMRKSRSNTAKDTVIMSNKSLKVFLVHNLYPVK